MKTKTDATSLAFSRGMLRLLREEMKASKTKAPRDYWTYDHGNGHFEFQAPDFYWHGSADNKFDARYKGITAWLEKFDPEGSKRMDDDAEARMDAGVDA